MVASILVDRGAEMPGVVHCAVVSQRQRMGSCGCYSVELLLVFFRIGVGHYITSNVDALGSRHPRARQWPRPTILCQLLCKFIGMLPESFCFSAKFLQFSRVVVRGHIGCSAARPDQQI